MIFQIENGCFHYDGGPELLKSINISIPKSRILAVLGPNGAGKTTLLKCMMGFLKWKSGKSTIDGQNIHSLPMRTLWKKISYVPQAKGNPLSYTGEEMVVLGRSVHLGMLAHPKKEDYERAHEAMQQVGVFHLRNRFCSTMSGGELQMILIARALTAQPEVLVLDEPESNLDFKNQLIILEIMQTLASQRGISCIFNTHYPDHALKIADDALLLDRSGFSLFGRSQDIINKDNMRRSFEVDVHINHLQIDQKEYASVIPISLL